MNHSSRLRMALAGCLYLLLAVVAKGSYVELRRVEVFTGDPTTFTPPVLANGRVYCRSYAGEVVCLATGK